MVSETYPSGRVVMNTFDSEGKNDSVSSRGNGHAPHIYANAFHYNDKGVMDRLRLGNALWEGSTVNSRFQTTQITLGTASGGSELLKLDYSYGSTNNNGNVQSQTITVPTIGSATGFVATQDYTYDALNRLASVEEKQYGVTTPDWRQQFGYDRYGNRAMGTGSTQTYGRNSTETQSLIGPDPTVSTSSNRITNKTGEHYEFDASGNMTKDALGNRSVYDIENHQTEYYYAENSTENPGATYFYDGDGKRIKKVVGTEVTIFVYDAGGRLVAEYTLGVTANSNPQTNYITTDTLGSTRLVTNGAGQVVARHDYLPFGDEIYGLGGRTSAQGFAQPDTTRQRFTGYEHDPESGLDFAQARYYGNGLGRFTGVDPLLESAKPALPQSWNRYSYTINSPLTLTDPSGQIWGYRDAYFNDQLVRIFQWFKGSKVGNGFKIFKPAKKGTWIQLTDGTYRRLYPNTNRIDAYYPPVEITIHGEGNANMAAGFFDGWVPGGRQIREAALGGPGSVDTNTPEYRNAHAISEYTQLGLAIADVVNVYRVVGEAGELIYIGITNNLSRRAAEHLLSSGMSIEAVQGLGRLSRADARAVEQVLIEMNGLRRNGGTLLNKINSISPRNPVYAESLSKGREILRAAGYPGLR